ncbi:hypothetical protein [Thiolinea disciformis]|uniref:hypothetical protein n=1 Tax=Thiolinea disciformis TaxID=125614 RepID=UPI00037877B7|nr:hypothetical protein [Thiolinea disciformis]
MNNQESKLVDEARLLLPWSLTGQLDKEEQAIVDAALEASTELRVEYAQEERMLRTVRENTSLLELSAMDTTELRLNKLLSRIDKEPAQAVANAVDDAATNLSPAIPSTWTKLKQTWNALWQGSSDGRTTWMTPANAVLSVLVLSQLALAGMYLVKPTKTETLYTVASVSSEQMIEKNKALFLMEFAPQAQHGEICDFLNQWNARIVSGPAANNLFIVALSLPKETDKNALAEKMMSPSQNKPSPVVFVGPQYMGKEIVN